MSGASGGGPEGEAPASSGRVFRFPVAPRPRNVLPATPPRVVGREDVIERLLLQIEHARLITLVGPGGIGKTTVALAVAERATGRCPDGVWFVDVAPLRDAALVPQAIAAAIGLTVHSEQVLPALCRALGQGRTLLVIDNCEHVAAAVAACVEMLLREAPGVRFLTTSRSALRVAGELTQPLEGLSSPPPTGGLTAALALTYPAVALFADRAADRLGSFALSDADAAPVADLCRSLDGIALAIELAAMRVDVFAVRELRSQLAGRLHLLAGRRRGLERHRSLAATLAWSYDLLCPTEARLLRAVSVFGGGFQGRDAAAVADLPTSIAVALLESLAAKSLLSMEHRADDPARGADATCRLLETTRVYAGEKLLEAGEDDAVRERHARHLCATLEAASRAWGQQRSRDWGETYGRYLDDLRAALDWADTAPDQADLMIRLTVAGTLLWNHFSLTDESRVRLTRGIARLPALAAPTVSITGAAIADADDPALRVRLDREMHLQFALAGATLYTRGITMDARRALGRALSLAERLGDADFRLRCLRLSGTLALFSGENDDGMRTLALFLSIASAEDPSALAEGETHFGVAETFVGRLHSARERMERLNAENARDFEDARFARFQYSNSVNMLVVLCHAQWLTGQPDAAARSAERVLALGLQSTHELSHSIGLAWNSLVYLWLGRDEDCARAAARLDDLVVRHGIVTWRPIATFCRGAIAARRDPAGGAGLEDMTQAIEECRRIGHLSRLPFYIAVFAGALAAAGRIAEAEQAIHEAWSRAVATNDQWCQPEVERLWASIAARQGRDEEAQALLLRSIERARAIGGLSWELRATCDLARLWRTGARADEARARLDAVLGRFTEGFGMPDLVAAAALRDELGAPPTLSPEDP